MVETFTAMHPAGDAVRDESSRVESSRAKLCRTDRPYGAVNYRERY